jgi:hypothetical protein
MSALNKEYHVAADAFVVDGLDLTVAKLLNGDLPRRMAELLSDLFRQILGAGTGKDLGCMLHSTDKNMPRIYRIPAKQDTGKT